MWMLAGRYSAVGIEMAAGLAIGTLGGRWLDEKAGTEPVFFWLGVIVGLGAATKTILRIVRTTKLDDL